jgi:hypothetical protein
MDRTCRTNVVIRNTYKFFVEKPQRKRSCEIPRCRYEDNIEMELTEIRCIFKCGEGVELAQDKVQ